MLLDWKIQLPIHLGVTTVLYEPAKGTIIKVYLEIKKLGALLQKLRTNIKAHINAAMSL